MEREYIVFGRNTANALGQIRSFGEAGIKTSVIWFGFDGHTPERSKYVKQIFVVNSVEDGLALLLDKFGGNPNKNILSTDNDGIVGFLDQNYDVLSPWFIFFNAGQKGRLSKMMTKYQMCSIASKVGLNVPKSEIVKVGNLPMSLNYPIFTKSLDSFDVHWKNSVSICRNEEELIEYYSKRRDGAEVLIQEYVEKENEYILQGVSINGGDELYIPIEGSYYRLPKDAYGSYLYFEKYKGGETLFNQLKAMFIEIGYSGVFEIEFLRGKDNKLYFLEINFRHTLWNHTFTDMGINLCTIWADSELAGHLVTGDATIKKERQNLMREFEDFKRCMKSKDISFWKWLKDLKNSDSFVMWDRNDTKPFWGYCIDLIKQRIL